MTEYLRDPQIVEYIAIGSIPFICGFVGWFTNKIALKMTFYPYRFWGIPPYLGWQGIIPRKAYKMAGKAVDLLTSRLISVEEMFAQVEPERVSREMAPVLEEVAEEIVSQVGQETSPGVWEALPDPLKAELVRQAQLQAPGLVEGIMADLKFNILRLFDIRTMVVRNLSGRNSKNLVEIFQRCGGPEFKFIEISGLYLGFLLGLVQMVVWTAYAEKWTLPVIGAMVGYVTNWLAIQMIFRPLQEKRILGFRYQGLFIKRQDEVSREYARLVAGRVLNPRKIFHSIIYGQAADGLMGIIQRNVNDTLRQAEGVAAPVVGLVLGRERYDDIKKFITESVTRNMSRSVRDAEDYLEEAMDLENTIYEKLSQLDPEEYESVLRTAFQEDEIILILVGAALGMLVGLAQALFVF